MTALPARSRPLVVIVALLALAGIAGIAPADGSRPAPVLPEQLRWLSPPGNPAVQGAWVLGAEEKPGPYLLRVKLAAGAKMPPHTHPDERNTTVLSGTLSAGFGATFDASTVVAVPAGGVYVAPANVPHYVWAKDGAVVYQESGVGPTATVAVTATKAGPGS
jgi:quercetin dioxygenase-like cupin family protein